MELELLNKNHHGLFFSIGKHWKGVYLHLPYKGSTFTIRLFLWGIDWGRHSVSPEKISEGKDTTIELKPTECALILDEDFTMNLYISNAISDEDDVPLNVRFLTMLAIKTKNEEFIEEMLDEFYRIVEDVEEEGEN